jgi:hypothetical protein
MGDSIMTANGFTFESDLMHVKPLVSSLSEVVGGMTHWDCAFNQVHAIARLEHDWDGDGAAPIGSHIIRSSSALLRKLRMMDHPAPNDVYPTYDGNIIVEWQSAEDIITRIEVDGLGTGEVMVSYPNAKCDFTRCKWIVSSHHKTFEVCGDLFASGMCSNLSSSSTIYWNRKPNGLSQDTYHLAG